MDKNIYKNYLAILREEMIPAMGCTEPIALAYGAARAREILGKEPEAYRSKMFRKYHQKCALCDHSQFRRLKGDSCRCDPWGGGKANAPH